jgi:hypothetical protein
VPGLSSVLFAPGARLVVVGIEQAGGWCSPSEYFGAMPYSRFLVEQFRRATAR